jgi:hypothetical protein
MLASTVHCPIALHITSRSSYSQLLFEGSNPFCIFHILYADTAITEYDMPNMPAILMGGF